MIEWVLETAWSFGPELAGLVGLGWLAVWIRRLSAVATYVRLGIVVGALGLVGAAVGVINVGRVLELATAGWRALMSVVAVSGGVGA